MLQKRKDVPTVNEKIHAEIICTTVNTGKQIVREVGTELSPHCFFKNCSACKQPHREHIHGCNTFYKQENKRKGPHHPVP